MNTTTITTVERLIPSLCISGLKRYELRDALNKHVYENQNISSGAWAVAIVGSRQWMSDAAIGDGITSATMALVTRCRYKDEASALPDSLNDLEPGLLPGQGFAWVYAARKYTRTDYIGQQNIDRYQTRDCDRRIAS